ncbi:MAG: hypothetical protein II834_04975 [Bacteroidaceae bacterium]|nr:hypothetical protein [Bacteroidaceae bacterium]
MHEYRGTENSRPHSYEVAKIELLDDNAQNRQPTNMEANNGAESNNNSISVAKLIKNVEKSYDKGKKLLDASEKTLPSGILYSVSVAAVLLNGLTKGFATYIDKEKAHTFLSHLSAPIAETAAKAELDSATNIIDNFENPKQNGGNLRFRDNGSNAAAHPDEADNTLRGVAVEYNKRLGESGYQVKEAVQDSMRSLLEVQRILEERSGKPLEDWENAYMAENAMSSRNNAEYEAWKRDNYKPLTEAVRALMESEGLSREGVEEYLYMKHGIERNREMSVRAAISEKAEREGKKAAHAEIRAQRDAAKQNGKDFKEPTDTERKRLEKQKAAELQKQLRSDWKQKREEIMNKYADDWEKAQRELDKAATQTRKPIFFATKVVA